MILKSKDGLFFSSRLVLSILFFVLAFSNYAMAQCTNYSNFLHEVGVIETDGTAQETFVQGDYAYVTSGTYLLIVNISNPSVPRLVGSVDLQITASSVCVSGTIAAISNECFYGCNDILYLVDISEPTNPTVLGQGTTDNLAQSANVAIVGSLAYVADSKYGNLFAYDISSPSDPQLVGTLVLNNPHDWIFGLVIRGNYAYMANSLGGLVVADISSPDSMTLLGHWHPGGYSSITDVTISGDYAYLGTQGDDYCLYIIDISEPSAPVYVSQYNTPIDGGRMKVVISGNTCYLGSPASPIYIFDVSNPAYPQMIDSLPLPGSSVDNDLAVFDSHLYATYGASGVQLTSISSPDPLEPISSINTPGDALNVFISPNRDNLAFVADGSSGFQIVDISNPLAPTIIRSVSTPGYATDISITGNLAYVADRETGLQIFDVTNPGSTPPTNIGNVDTPGLAIDVAVVDTLVFIADSEGGVHVVNVKIPESPQIIATQDTLAFAGSIDVQGDYAYVAAGLEGLQVLNISDPDNPWIVGGVKGRSWTNATEVSVFGSRAYVADADSGMFVIDISNPGAFQELGRIGTADQARGIVIDGNYAYVADSAAGLKLIDVTDSENPSNAGNVDVPSISHGVFVTDDFAYVAAGAGGLQVCPSQCGYSEAVMADFTVSVAEEFYPLLVDFTNYSTGYAAGYQWDFGDGIGYSTDVNPSYYYDSPGYYTATLTVTGSGNTDSISHDISVLAKEPRITDVVDVPDDQGGFVYIDYNRSGYDDTSIGRSEMYTIQRQDGERWVTVATSGAFGDDTYSVLAGTQGDGSESWSTSFRVIAHMDEGLWRGPIVTGFSEDNIAPAVPQNIVWLEGGDLSWDQVPDSDFAYYQIYGSPTSSFAESEPVGATIDTSYPAPTGQYPWFFITAVDDYGNHSTPVLSPDFTSGVPAAIKTVSLSAAVPNPFNPSTHIEYALPKTAQVRLAVYDLSGHLVKTLINEVMETGIHGIDWQGTDEADRGVSAGTYFYRLETGDKVITRRMMLIK